MSERRPTEDEQAGMSWWNGLSEPERAAWLSVADSAVAADAWAAFKAARRLPVPEQDPDAWSEGHRAGLRGSDWDCPHEPGTIEAWSWANGLVEGAAERTRQMN